MDRITWRRLADVRAGDAEALLAAGRWPATYYLAGYAVECGLKACILAHVESHSEVIFSERRFSDKCWTHDLEALVVLSNLKTALDADTAGSIDLLNRWLVVKEWDEQARYRETAELQAREMYDAVTDLANGVLPWIKARW